VAETELINPENPEGPYRFIFSSEDERREWAAENRKKQKAYVAKRRRWCKSINFPWPGKGGEDDIDPPPATIEMEDPENG
jgi:hypothetical protein